MVKVDWRFESFSKLGATRTRSFPYWRPFNGIDWISTWIFRYHSWIRSEEFRSFEWSFCPLHAVLGSTRGGLLANQKLMAPLHSTFPFDDVCTNYSGWSVPGFHRYNRGCTNNIRRSFISQLFILWDIESYSLTCDNNNPQIIIIRTETVNQ